MIDFDKKTHNKLDELLPEYLKCGDDNLKIQKFLDKCRQEDLFNETSVVDLLMLVGLCQIIEAFENAGIVVAE